MIRISHVLAALVAASLLPTSALAAVIDFEDFPIGPDSYYAPGHSDVMTLGDASFNYDYDSMYGSWSGWTISNKSDMHTAGYLNQFSAYATTGAGTNNYALAYAGVDGWGTQPFIGFGTPTVVESVQITNTTYSVLSMLQGDGFAKRFGGASGNDPDWFLLTFDGYNSNGDVTGSVDFYLADYRFADNSLDYIVTDWTLVNLAGLGEVSGLGFRLTSSDTGMWGMNTPSYFAMDSLTTASPVPWPAAPWLYGAGLAVVGMIRRRKASI